MKISLSKDAQCSGVSIPTGDYWVSLLSESQQMQLTGRGQDFRIAAVRRRSKTKQKTTSVSFYSGGGPQWSLVFSSPKLGEWVALLELQPSTLNARR
jgi:hypothetical protein